MRVVLTAVSMLVALLVIAFLTSQQLQTLLHPAGPVISTGAGASASQASSAVVAGPGDVGEPMPVLPVTAASGGQSPAQQEKQFRDALSKAMQQPAAPNESDGR